MKKDKHHTLVPEIIGVKTILTEDLFPNPHNPRMLFDKQPMDILRASIKKVGILVPLTVYWSSSKEHYVILDGQRRWMCAQEIGLKKVPVNQVAEPSLVQNIVTMFQIHKFREDWQLMPTALKVEVLMNELNEKREQHLAALTGLDQAVVVRCKKLLSYPRKYQDLMLDPNPEKRIKADFFIELYAVKNDRIVRKMDWFSKNTFTDRMLEKYQTKASGLKAVTDFRIMKQHINNAVKAGKVSIISKRLREFSDDDSLTLDHLIIQSASVSANAKKLVKDIKKVESEIQGINTSEFYGEEELWETLEGLFKTISTLLSAAGRRVE